MRKMTTGKKKGIIFGKGTRLYPIDDDDHSYDFTDVNAAFYVGFAQALLQTPEEAAELTPLDRIAFSYMAKAKSEYLNRLRDAPVSFEDAHGFVCGVCEGEGIDPDYLTDK